MTVGTSLRNEQRLPMTPFKADEINKTLFLIENPTDTDLFPNQEHGVDSTPIFVRLLENDRGIQMIELLRANGEPSLLGKASLELALVASNRDARTVLSYKQDELLTELLVPIGPHLCAAMMSAGPFHGKQTFEQHVFITAIAESRLNGIEGWANLSSIPAAKRFTASTWFERDRKNLTLCDELTQTDIVELWDEDVDQALEDGYLNRPTKTSGGDEDWVEPLLDYARSQGLMTGYELDSIPGVLDLTPSACDGEQAGTPVPH